MAERLTGHRRGSALTCAAHGPGRPRHPRRPAPRDGAVRDQEGDRRAGPRHRAPPRLPPRPRPLPARGRARSRQDADVRDDRPGHRRQLRPPPVHPRPAARRPRRHPGLPGVAPRPSTSSSGPVFANLVLADEINRAPAKVQSALLEVMAEHQVSIGGQTHEVPDPFLVLATQNPIESEGVYPLPEAQRDRFLMKVLLGYPSRSRGGRDRAAAWACTRPGPSRCSPPRTCSSCRPPPTASTSTAASSTTPSTSCSPPATRAAVGLGELAELLQYGASPRASLGLVAAGRALALLRGRGYVLPQDVFDVAPDVLRHRLVLSYEALARDLTPDHILARILSTVPAPRIAPSMSPTARTRPSPRPRPPAPAGPSSGSPRPTPGPPSRSPRRQATRSDLPHDASGPGRPRCCAASSSPSPAASTACCTATTAASCPATAPSPARPASTSPATTSAASTGTSPPACRPPTSARPSPTASSRRGCSSTSRPASSSAPPSAPSATRPWPPPPPSASSPPRGGNRVGAVLALPGRPATHHPGPRRPRPPPRHPPPHPDDDGRGRHRRHRPRRRRSHRLSRASPPPRPRGGHQRLARRRPDRGAGRRGSRRCAGSPCATRRCASRSSTLVSSSSPTSASSSSSTPRPAAAARSRPATPASAPATRRPPSARRDPARRLVPRHGRRPPRAAHRPRLARRHRHVRRHPARPGRGPRRGVGR